MQLRERERVMTTHGSINVLTIIICLINSRYFVSEQFSNHIPSKDEYSSDYEGCNDAHNRIQCSDRI